jgi:hypothetical protein
MSDGIIIPFSFPEDPNVGQLLASIKKLKDETNALSNEISKMPIEELRTKYQQWLTVLSSIQLETQKTNQSNKQHQSLLLKNADIVSELVTKLQQNIDLQKLFNLEGEKQQKVLDGINKATLKAIEGLSALNQKELEGEKLTSAQTTAKIKYGETIKKNTDLITLFNAQLKEHSIQLKESSENTELIAGHITLLEGLIKNLTTEWKNLDESELKNADTTKYYSETIGALNVELNKYRTQIGGTLELETQLNKAREQNIIIENKTIALAEVDVDIKARQIIANNELNAAISNRVSVLTTGYTLEELKAIENAKIQQEADEKQIASGEKRAEAMNVIYNAEKGSIIELKNRIALLSAEWDRLGPASQKANKEIKKSLVDAREELILLEEQAHKSGGAVGVLTTAWRFLQTSFFRGIGTMLIWGALFGFFFKLWEIITQGTDAIRKQREELEKYQEKLRDIKAEEFSQVAKTISDAKDLLSIASNIHLTDLQRIDAIRTLRKEHQGLLQQYKDEELLQGKSEAFEKKLEKVTYIQAKIDIAKKSIEAATKDQIKDEAELQDLGYIKSKGEDYRNKRLKELNQLPKSKFTALSPERAEYASLSEGDIPDDIIYDQNTPEGRNAKRRAELQTWYQKIFGDKRTVNITQVSNRIKTLQQNIKNYEQDKTDFQKDVNKNRADKNDLMKDDDKDRLNVNLITAEIDQLEDDIKNSIDLRKYGLSIKTITGKDVDRLRSSGKIEGDESEDVKKKISDISRLKDVRRRLLGRNLNQGRHPKDRSFQTDLADARIRHDTNLTNFQDEFDLSPQGLTDMEHLHQKRIDEESRYQEELDLIWKKEATSAGLTSKQLKKIKDDEIKEIAQDKKQRDKQNEDYIFSLKKYYEDLDKVIKTGQEAIIRTQIEIEKSSSEDSYNRSSSARTLKGIRRFNPFTAFFGGSGGQSANEDFKDARARSLENEKRANEELGVSGFNLFRKNKEIDADKYNLGNDSLNLDLTSKSGRDTIKNDNDKLTRDLQERAAIQKDYDEKLAAAKKAGENTSQLEAEHRKQEQLIIAKTTFDSLEKIANSSFALQQRRIKAQMDNIQNLADFELKLAGNNSGAKIRIAQTEHRQMLALKRKEAEVEKSQALYSAFVDMGKGIAASYSQGGLAGAILAGIVITADLLAISQIQQTPLPQYRGGKKSGQGRTGLARVGEEGDEIAIGPSGGLRILNDGIAPVYKDDTIFTHKESKELVGKNDFLSTLLKGTGVITQRDYLEKKERHNSIQQSITKQDFQEVMDKAISKLPKQDYIAPAQDVQDRHTRQQLRNGL